MILGNKTEKKSSNQASKQAKIIKRNKNRRTIRSPKTPCNNPTRKLQLNEVPVSS